MILSISPDLHIALVQQERQREAEAVRLAELARHHAKAQRAVVRPAKPEEGDR